MDDKPTLGDPTEKEVPFSKYSSAREKKRRERRLLSATEKKEKIRDKREEAYRAATRYLSSYKPKKSDSTYCVFLNSEFGLVCYGESGWDKGKYTPLELGTLSQAKHVRSDSVGQAVGYGPSCAEPHALVEAAKKKLDHTVTYSLAYDQNSGDYKAACGTCEPLLKLKEIDDLYYE